MSPQTKPNATSLAGLYIHIPFCKSKCPYCSFSSFPITGQNPSQYMEALLKQAETMAEHPWSKTVQFAGLFLGGGTPTIYKGEELARLINTCRTLFPFIDNPEITVEANPNSVNGQSLSCLRRAGVNRLSLGVQSFSDRLLLTIGRSHSANDAKTSLRLAKEAGIDNINIDLIYGLPGQTLNDWHESLAEALSFDPGHFSLYELMIEEGTPFAKNLQQGQLTLPAEEEVVAMAETISNLIESAGYSRYEISNYARPDRHCRHNIIYWQNGPYLGLGAAAVSCLNGMRIKTVDDPYLFTKLVNNNDAPYQEAECLPLEASFRETVIMGLRMKEGVSTTTLFNQYGLEPWEYYGPTIEKLKTAGLIQQTGDRLSITAKGFPIANQVLTQLV